MQSFEQLFRAASNSWVSSNEQCMQNFYKMHAINNLLRHLRYLVDLLQQPTRIMGKQKRSGVLPNGSPWGRRSETLPMDLWSSWTAILGERLLIRNDSRPIRRLKVRIFFDLISRFFLLGSSKHHSSITTYAEAESSLRDKPGLIIYKNSLLKTYPAIPQFSKFSHEICCKILDSHQESS